MIQSDVLAGALGSWRSRPGPIYVRLADALGEAVSQGLVGAGTRLPAERVLARSLHVSRGTVVAAYDTLRRRRVARTVRGSGTVVITGAAPPEIHRAPLLSRLVDGGNAPIDLAIGAPQVAEELPEVSIALRDAARLAPAHGYAPLGIAPLRVAIAELISRHGVPTGPEEVIVTAGGQGALSLVAAGLVGRGDRVVVEAPTYPAAIEVFERAGARVTAVERDHAGPLPDQLARALSVDPVRLLYLVPTCHNPTGGVMSERRRREVLSLARRHGAMIVEDTVLEHLLMRGTAPPPIASADRDAVVITGSLSKTIWGGLRVGWVRAPAGVVLRLGRIKSASDLGGSVVEQALAVTLLERFEELAARRREMVAERLGTLAEQVATHLPEWTFPTPHGGWSLWARLPRGSGDDLAQLALRRGVAIAPGRSAAPDDRFTGYVRLCAGPPPPLLREGVVRLADAWRELCALPRVVTAEPLLTV